MGGALRCKGGSSTQMLLFIIHWDFYFFSLQQLYPTIVYGIAAFIIIGIITQPEERIDGCDIAQMQPVMVSFNQKYPPRPITADADFHVVGRVL